MSKEEKVVRVVRSAHEAIARECKFDSKRDFQEVEQGLVVSLSETLKTGVVKESQGTLESNGITDPEKIVGVCRDRFDAIDAERAIRKHGRKAELPAGVQSESVSDE